MALNITTAVIGSGCNTATASPSLVQWDQGQILKIEGVQLPETYQAEFCCQGDTETLTMLGSAEGVGIPDELLARGLPIVCYIVLHEGDDDRETEYTIRIYVQQRAEPTDIAPDPGQQSLIDQMLAILTDADSAVSAYRADEILNAGNILADVGTFNARPSPALTFSWSDGNTRAHITGTPAYQSPIGIYSTEDSGGLTFPLEYDTEYELVFGADTDLIKAFLWIGSTEQELTGNTRFTIPRNTSFEIGIIVEAGTIDSNVLIGIPYPKSHLDLKEATDSVAADVAGIKATIDATDLTVGYDLPLVWEQGNLNSTGEAANTRVIRTAGFFASNNLASIKVKVSEGYKATLVRYTSANAVSGWIGGATGTTVLEDGQVLTYDDIGQPYFRFKLEPNPSDVILPAAGSNLGVYASTILPEYAGEKRTGIMGALLGIADSYFRVAYAADDIIVYQSQRGLYEENIYSDDGDKAIVCSMFVTAVLGAVLYQNSRYVQETNDSLWWGWHSDGTGTYRYDDYMVARDIAAYCQDHGWLFPFDADHQDIKPGDLLFFNSQDATIANIGHTSIAVWAGKEHYVSIEGSSTGVRILDNQSVGMNIAMHKFSNTSVKYYARIPMIPTDYLVERILNDQNTYNRTVASGSTYATVRRYNFDTPLESGFYSFLCEYEGDGYPYIRVAYDTNPQKAESISTDEALAKEYDLVFYAQLPVKYIEVRCYRVGDHEVKNVALYKGFALHDLR